MRKRIPPKPGQESVWDYPRPPKLEASSKTIRIEMDGELLVQTTKAFRVLETSHPPVYYLPPEDINMTLLRPHKGRTTFCEWKGAATYWDYINDCNVIPLIGWSYPSPTGRFEQIQDYLAFYPSKLDAAYIDGELVQAQEGDFYGGWITKDIVGPFKGGAGTWGW